jgi:hypothetical protein
MPGKKQVCFDFDGRERAKEAMGWLVGDVRCKGTCLTHGRCIGIFRGGFFFIFFYKSNGLFNEVLVGVGRRL